VAKAACSSAGKVHLRAFDGRDPVQNCRAMVHCLATWNPLFVRDSINEEHQQECRLPNLISVSFKGRTSS